MEQSADAPDDADLRAVIGARIREQRLARGRSLSWLAQAAGISPSQLRRIELGETTLWAATLWELSRALAVPVNQLQIQRGGRWLRTNLECHYL